MDGYTPDKRPVVGAAGPDGLYLALGFSGGGFKLAPAVAELAALEIAEGGAVPGKAVQELLEPYRPQRFLAGNPIRPEAPYDHM
ncbi:FAD-dependent oxidoreductase [Streptomyces sp. CS62]|uniref:FAD-dependent oxidoreductase n=1 Tax=Streptomyces sp. CS62 TaxID=3119268 RepID=UPI003FA6940B